MGRSSSRSRRKTKFRNRFGYTLSFLLGVFLALGGYHLLIREKPLSQEDFSHKIFLVDQAIQSQFYQMGIPKKNVLLQPASPKKEKDFTWKLSSMKVQILSTTPLSLVEENFSQNISALGKPVSIKSTQIKQTLHLEIKISDRITHQLAFVTMTPSAMKTGFRARVAIVIDDLGIDNNISQELLRWKLPITLSILPFTPYAKTLAEEAHQKGREVILHLPMEPRDYPQARPGEGTLFEQMNDKDLLNQLSKDIDAVPYIKGVNNHMGSRLTADPGKMKIILTELKRRDLFFLDSRTTSETTGLRVAHSIGLTAGERSVFLDNSSNEADIKKQLEQLIQLSLSNGKAIAIGHPHPTTIKSLREFAPRLKEKGIEVVPLSSIME